MMKSIFVKAIFLLPTRIVFRLRSIVASNMRKLYAVVFFSIQPERNDRKNERRKALALEGVHPYNPLTGIMLRRVLSLDGP